MKTTLVAIVASAFIAGALIVSCKSPEEKMQDAKENAIDAKKDFDVANEQYIQEIENYRIETAKEIESNDKSLSEFETKLAKEKAEVREDYKKQVAVLRKRNAEMKEKMANYKANGKENWEKFKSEFKHDMKELGQAFKDIGVNNVK